MIDRVSMTQSCTYSRKAITEMLDFMPSSTNTLGYLQVSLGTTTTRMVLASHHNLLLPLARLCCDMCLS